jgi:hypothetical protein
MLFAELPYDVAPGGATEAVIHVPAVIVVVALLLSGSTPQPEAPRDEPPPEAPEK